VIVHNLDVFGATRGPAKAHAKLVIDANTVLARTIAFQRFQAIAGRDSQIIQSARDFQLSQLASRNGCDVREPLDRPAFGKSFSVDALERFNHALR
jgi:hypothetical protein